MTALELLLLTSLVFVSAYMAAAEVSLFSLSRFQLRYIKDRARAQHRRIKKLLADPGGLLLTILVVNEILNISISMLITRGVAQTVDVSGWPSSWPSAWVLHALLGTLISAPVILVVCEVTPKVIAARANQLVATLTVNAVTVIYQIFMPVRLILKRVVTKEETETLNESDFLLMVEEGHREGAIQASEVELIKNVFELDDTTVADVFTPLAQVKSFVATITVRDALNSIRQNRFSRIPVTSANNKREIVGILYSKDLLRAKLESDQLNLPISELILEPVFVASTMKLNALFRRFKQQKTHMAVVQNKPGEALGIITMSDVMDTLFDDLFPEDAE